VTGELGRGLLLILLFAIGLAAGIAILVSPWALGYAGDGAGAWTTSVWSDVAVGAVVGLASAASLVVVLARAVHVTLASRPEER
jgi:hypothetical protein